MASTLTTPYDFAVELLELCHQAVSDTTGGAIARRYVSPGRPAYDCEQLTVAVWTLGEADTVVAGPMAAGKRHMSGRVNLVGFLITVLRDCVPVLNEEQSGPPDADKIQASAKLVDQDVWAIWTYVYAEMRRGGLFGGRCEDLFMDGARALETEGTLAGFEVEIRANIPGIINAS